MSSHGPSIAEEIRTYLKRFCVLPSEECYDAAVLWVMHTYCAEELYTTPRLAALSPEYECGKSRLLELLASISYASLPMLNAHAAPVFRSLGAGMRTIFIDEADMVWKKAGKDDGQGDLQALMNGGYRRGLCKVSRCVPPKYEVRQFDVFSPVCLAGVGDCIPESVLTRSIIFRMRRKLPTEQLEAYKPRAEEKRQEELRGSLEEWAGLMAATVGDNTPDMPASISDRQAEIWEPLFSVAQAINGRWPEAVKKSCIALSNAARVRAVQIHTRLLADIRMIFEDIRVVNSDKAIHSADLCERLKAMGDDAPWANIKGFPLSVRYMASLLSRYEIRPEKITIAGVSLQGYRASQFNQAWTLYTSSPAITAFIEAPSIPAIPDARGEMRGCLPNLNGTSTEAF